MGIFDLFSNETKQRDKLLRKYSSEQLADTIASLYRHCFHCVIHHPLDNDVSNQIENMILQVKNQYGTGLEATKKLCDFAVECKRSGRLKEAIEFYRQASELMPTRSMTYYSLAKSLYLLNCLEEAISAYKLAYIYTERVTSDLFRHAGHALYDAGREDTPTAIEYRKSIAGQHNIVIGGQQYYSQKIGNDANDYKYIKLGMDVLKDLRILVFYK